MHGFEGFIDEGDEILAVGDVVIDQSLSGQMMLLSYPTRDRQDADELNIVKAERRERPYEHIYRRAGHLEAARPPVDYDGKEYTLNKTQLGFTVAYKPVERASNERDEGVGVMKMVTKPVPMHWNYAVLTLDPTSDNQCIAPLLGASLVVPYFGERDDADRAKELLSTAGADTGMARQKREGTGLEWQPVHFDRTPPIAIEDALRGLNVGGGGAADEEEEDDGAPVAMQMDPAPEADPKKSAPPRNARGGLQSYLDRIMVSHDESFRREERARLQELEASSVRGTVMGSASLDAKVCAILARVGIISFRELRDLFKSDRPGDAASPDAVTDQQLMEALHINALLVRGVWVDRQQKIVPEPPGERSLATDMVLLAAQKATMQWNYLLWMFAQSTTVSRKEFITKVGCTQEVARAMLERVAVLDTHARAGERRWFLKLGPCPMQAMLFPDMYQQFMEKVFSQQQGDALLSKIQSFGFAGRKIKKEKREGEVRVKLELTYEEVYERVVAHMLRFGVVGHSDVMKFGAAFPDQHLRTAIERCMVQLKPKLYVLNEAELAQRTKDQDPHFAQYVWAFLKLLCPSKGGTPIVKKSQLVEGVKQAGLPTMSPALYKQVIWLVARSSGTNWTLKTGRQVDDPANSVNLVDKPE